MMREEGNWDTLHVGINDENAEDEEILIKDKKAAFYPISCHSISGIWLIYGAVVGVLLSTFQTITSFIPC